MIETTLTEYMNHKYATRKDKSNIFGVGISDKEFVDFAIKYLLGEDWCITDPIGHTQVIEIALYQILERYSKSYNKEVKNTEAFFAKKTRRKHEKIR